MARLHNLPIMCCRLAALIAEGSLDVECVRMLVLDEADKLLEPAFMPELQSIVEALPRRKQVRKIVDPAQLAQTPN